MSLVKVAFMCVVVVQFTGCRQCTHGYTPKEKAPLYQKPLTACSSSSRFWWLYGALPESHGDVDVHSSAGNYGYREFLSVVAMSYPEDV